MRKWQVSVLEKMWVTYQVEAMDPDEVRQKVEAGELGFHVGTDPAGLVEPLDLIIEEVDEFQFELDGEV
jgi:hypothetical protein